MSQQQIAPPTNALALAGVVLGWIVVGIGFILGIFHMPVLPTFILLLVPGLLVIVFGFVGITTAGRMGGLRRGQAITAVVLGFLPMAGWAIGGFLAAAIFGL